MKHLKYIILVAITLHHIGVIAQNQATITCKVMSEYPVKVVFQEPFEEFSSILASIDTCRSKGYSNNVMLTRKMPLKNPTYLRVAVYDSLEVFRGVTELVVCPNEEVTINLSLNDRDGRVSFNGENADGHAYFNAKRQDRIAFYQPIKDYLYHLSTDSLSFTSSVHKLINAYVAPYDSLYHKEKITKAYLCLVLKYGYRLNITYAAFLKTILGVLYPKDTCNLLLL